MTTPSIIPRASPGSRGEHELQEPYGTRARAVAFCTVGSVAHMEAVLRRGRSVSGSVRSQGE
jgi:hypothetical protein